MSTDTNVERVSDQYISSEMWCTKTFEEFQTILYHLRHTLEEFSTIFISYLGTIISTQKSRCTKFFFFTFWQCTMFILILVSLNLFVRLSNLSTEVSLSRFFLIKYTAGHKQLHTVELSTNFTLNY